MDLGGCHKVRDRVSEQLHLMKLLRDYSIMFPSGYSTTCVHRLLAFNYLHLYKAIGKTISVHRLLVCKVDRTAGEVVEYSTSPVYRGVERRTTYYK